MWFGVIPLSRPLARWTITSPACAEKLSATRTSRIGSKRFTGSDTNLIYESAIHSRNCHWSSDQFTHWILQKDDNSRREDSSEWNRKTNMKTKSISFIISGLLTVAPLAHAATNDLSLTLQKG